MGALPSKPDDAADGPPNAFVVCELKDQMKLGGRMHNIVDSVMAGRVGHTATLTQIINPGDHTPHANTSNCDVFAVAADISRFRHSAQVEAKSADGVRLHIAFALGRLLPAARKGVDKIIVITSDTVRRSRRCVCVCVCVCNDTLLIFMFARLIKRVYFFYFLRFYRRSSTGCLSRVRKE